MHLLAVWFGATWVIFFVLHLYIYKIKVKGIDSSYLTELLWRFEFTDVMNVKCWIVTGTNKAVCPWYLLLPLWQLSVGQGHRVIRKFLRHVMFRNRVHLLPQTCIFSGFQSRGWMTPHPVKRDDFSVACWFFLPFIFGIILPFSSWPPLPQTMPECHLGVCTLSLIVCL